MTLVYDDAGLETLRSVALFAPPSVRRWFVLQYVGTSDRLVFRWLAWLGVEFYQFTHLRKTVDGPKRVTTFPGYLFVCFDVASLSWVAIKNIPGVIRILSGMNGYPIPLPAGLLETMIEFHGSRPITAPADFDPIRIGENVRITSGPFEGRCGEVEFTDEQIVGVFVTIFNRRQTVKLSKKALARSEAVM